MSPASFRALPDVVRAHAKRLAGPRSRPCGDYDSLIERVGEADVVLLGSATHGSHEFYLERIRITQRLIAEKGFLAVAVEADWPAAHRIDSFVRDTGDVMPIDDAFTGFHRFPTWIWCNAEVRSFVGWLRKHNDTSRDRGGPGVGFFGLDLYSMRESMHEVVTYLTGVDPDAAHRARRRYSCFDQHGADPQEYGVGVSLGVSPSCEHLAVRQLLELQSSRAELIEKVLTRESQAATAARTGSDVASEKFFNAERNAAVVVKADEYYRALFGSRARSWNLRESHMADVTQALVRHLRRHSARPRIVVWAHNSHVGDVHATSLAALGETSLGQILRERMGAGVWSVGFTTHRGTVTAAKDWDAPPEDVRLTLSSDGSLEAAFHATGLDRFLLTFRGDEALKSSFRDAAAGPTRQRSIGVIYRPDASGQPSHCIESDVTQQFDAILHIDETHALSPLDGAFSARVRASPDNYPFTL